MYACPNCGGGLKFDIESQQLRCDYCSNTFDPYSIVKEEDESAFIFITEAHEALGEGFKGLNEE